MVHSVEDLGQEVPGPHSEVLMVITPVALQVDSVPRGDSVLEATTMAILQEEEDSVPEVVSL